MTGRRVLAGLGVALIGVGIVQLLLDRERTNPILLLLFVVGLAVLDDLVLIPFVLFIGWLASRFLPARAVAPAQAGLIVFSGACLVGLVWVLSPARDAEAGTLLTLPYGRNVALIAAGVAISVAAVVAWRVARPVRR
jgi:hypothetical protein